MTSDDIQRRVPESVASRWEKRVPVWLAVVVIGVAALALRLGYVLLTEPGMAFPDEKQYWHIAENFAGGQGLRVIADTRTGEPIKPALDIQRPPVYPLALAVVRKLGFDLRTVRVIQALLGAATCLMIYLLAKELMGEWPGRLAGAIAAIYPFTIYFTGRILSETLFLLLFVTSWYYIVRMWRELSEGAPWTRWAASLMLAGLLSAASALTRPEVLAAYVAVPPLMLVIGPRRLKGLGVGVLMLLVVVVGMSPWIARNYRVTTIKNPQGDLVRSGRLVITTLKVGESLYEAVAPRATGGPNKENTVWPEPAGRPDEYARDRFLRDRALVYLRNDKKRMIELAGKKFLRTWNIFPNYEAVRTPFYMIVSAAAIIPVLLSGILGLFLSVKRPRAALWLLLPIMVFTLVHMVFVGSIRYRLVMMPFVMSLSGMGVWWVVCKVLEPTQSAAKV